MLPDSPIGAMEKAMKFKIGKVVVRVTKASLTVTTVRADKAAARAANRRAYALHNLRAKYEALKERVREERVREAPVSASEWLHRMG